MLFVFGGALLWWGALGDLMVWGVLAGGGSYVLEGCSSVLGPAVSDAARGGSGSSGSDLPGRLAS